MLLIEIREHFATLVRKGTRKLLSDDVDAWSFVDDESFGVILRNPNEIEIMQEFSNVKLFNSNRILDNKEIPVMILSSNIESTRREFANICLQFVELGDLNSNRELITEDPFTWSKKWESLLGNSLQKKRVYDVLAELLAVEHLFDEGHVVYWSGPDNGVRDIESKDFLVDVKSTQIKYDTNITISGQYQLETDKDLYIYFCRVEPSMEGDSINSVVHRLRTKGMDMFEIESKLKSMGYERRRLERDQTFNILEKKIYKVDDEFPKITASDFKSGKLPDYIVKIEYTINLDALKFEIW